MATFSASKTNTSPPRLFVENVGMLSQSPAIGSGTLNKITTEALQPIQRLLESLEKENDKCHQGLQVYIDSLRPRAGSIREAEFTHKVLDVAWQVWNSLKKQLELQGSRLEVPDASPGHSDNFMYVWSRGSHYLECEVFGNGDVEFFYRNRKTNEVWGEDVRVEQEFSGAILDKAALFAW